MEVLAFRQIFRGPHFFTRVVVAVLAIGGQKTVTQEPARLQVSEEAEAAAGEDRQGTQRAAV
jgi:hypothetical protein